jgi:glutathione peroxidase-family protein
MDETNFYTDLYDKYHSKGLQIIGVAYEYPSEFNDQTERVKSYIKNLEVPYPILIGGRASKDKASSDFHMLNSISSFPTSIFINKKGEVVKIHTGFNGPGTGEVYKEYVKKTNSLIEKLLNE